MGPTRTDEFRKDAVRIALSSKDQDLIRGIKFPEDGLTRKQIASDLGVGMSTLNKWIIAHRDTDLVSVEDRDLARENERLRKENRILKDLRRIRKQSGGLFSRRLGSIWRSPSPVGSDQWRTTGNSSDQWRTMARSSTCIRAG